MRKWHRSRCMCCTFSLVQKCKTFAVLKDKKWQKAPLAPCSVFKGAHRIKMGSLSALPWGLYRQRSGCACAPDPEWFQQHRNASPSHWTRRAETGGSAGRPLQTYKHTHTGTHTNTQIKHIDEISRMDQYQSISYIKPFGSNGRNQLGSLQWLFSALLPQSSEVLSAWFILHTVAVMSLHWTVTQVLLSEAGWLAAGRLSRKYLEVRSVEGGRCSAA